MMEENKKEESSTTTPSNDATQKASKEARMRERRKQRLAQMAQATSPRVEVADDSKKNEEEGDKQETHLENSTVEEKPNKESNEMSKAEREARMRERRKQRLTQSASSREELITGIKRDTPAENPTRIEDLLNPERLQQMLNPEALSWSVPQWVKKGSLAVVFIIIAMVAYSMVGALPAGQSVSVVVTTDSGSAFFTRRIAFIQALGPNDRLIKDDVVAAYTTTQHQRIVRAVVMNSISRVPGEEEEEEQLEMEETKQQNKNDYEREWKIAPIVAKDCCDGEWLSQKVIVGRVRFSISIFMLTIIGPLLLRYLKWAVK